MPFGMHRGKLLTSLPKGYIDWFLEQDEKEPIDKDLKYSLELLNKVK
jgi:uncharacterized protein (DUF3820 family)